MISKATCDLMNLPETTKELINSGVFSLYSLKGDNKDAFYILYARDNTFLLKKDGSVLKKIDGETKSYKIDNSINFNDLPKTNNFILDYKFN